MSASMRRRYWHALGWLAATAWPLSLASANAERAEKLTRQVAVLDRRLAAVEDELQGKQAAIAHAADVWARTQSEKSGLRLRQRRCAQVLRRRVGALARASREGQVRPWQGTQRLGELVLRNRLLRAVSAHDRQLYEQAQAATARLEQSGREQARASQTLKQARGAQRALRESLADERRRRHDALAALQQQREAGATWLQQRQASEGRVAALSAPIRADGSALGAQAAGDAVSPSSTDAAARLAEGRGLPWPTAGRVRSRFGDQVELAFGTTTRHNGLRIGAPHGSRVVAVAPGSVVFADWLTGFGRTVIVAHEHSVHTVHAHLARMHVRYGDAVAAGQLLGFVGDSGTTRGAALYFEVRAHGQPQDPMRYLQAEPG